MNRRTFLKSLTAVCGAAVVCPGELLKKKRHPGLDKIPYGIPYWLCNKDGSIIEGEIFDEFASPRDIIFFNSVPIVYRSPLYDETIQTTK